MMTVSIMAVVYTVFQVLLLTVCDNDRSSKYYVKIKMACSTLFLIFALIAFFKNGFVVNAFYAMIGAGLGFCWLGDLFLGFYNQKHIKKDMLAGILFFALAHIAFLLYMYSLHPSFNWFIIVCPIALLILMAILTGVCRFKMGSLKPACFAYSVFISSMFAKAVYDIFLLGDLESLLLGIGGILFFVSDFSILFLYFYYFPKKSHRVACHYFNLLTYYYGIFFFIMSIMA